MVLIFWVFPYFARLSCQLKHIVLTLWTSVIPPGLSESMPWLRAKSKCKHSPRLVHIPTDKASTRNVRTFGPLHKNKKVTAFSKRHTFRILLT
jgi:hypothetical protein